MIESIAIGLLTNIISSIVYDSAKKGLEHCFYSSKKNELLEQMNEIYKNSEYNQQELKDVLYELKNNQNLMFSMLSKILHDNDLKTTLNVYNNQITFNVPASDVFKLQQIIQEKENSNETPPTDSKVFSLTEVVATIPSDEEILNTTNRLKNLFSTVEPVDPASPIFMDWFKRKCDKEALFFPIDGISYYSISRAVIYENIKHNPHLYVMDTSDCYNYTYYSATENKTLSDVNNIIIKPTIEKGYIVVVNGTFY